MSDSVAIPRRRGFSKKFRAKVAEQTNYRCAYCGEILSSRFYIDHVKSFYSGGSNEADNLKASCFSCNSFKRAMTLEQFRNEMRQQLERAHKYSRNYRMALKYKLVTENEKPIIFYFEGLLK